MHNHYPTLLAADLEGVFIPEIWIAVAEQTGIEKLRLTTRDMSDYNELMQMRLGEMQKHNLTLETIQNIIAQMDPLPGAIEFLEWVRERSQLIILTDSYYQFVAPILPKLNHPTVFAHTLEVSEDGVVTNYHLRTPDGKRQAVDAFQKMGFRTMAVGDSYNDTTMLLAAHEAALFCPPPNVIADFPQLQVAENYTKLKEYLTLFLNDS
ncbi:bifunctional phosphoserine phosphatase/homoserine phosphotransferase ThrH [Chloroflexi bacterium TSY]|nr:bifunctional phosphoserine phosphatase/homoserine phosphotransferase ThrH [Chloroflexi bacterium TSY]